MIVWGGGNIALSLGPYDYLLSFSLENWFNDGGRYDPITDTWLAVTTTGAPRARIQHTGVWTGTEMLVWGGNSPTNVFNDGGRYNSETGSWLPIITQGAPAPRSGYTAVWTAVK